MHSVYSSFSYTGCIPYPEVGTGRQEQVGGNDKGRVKRKQLIVGVAVKVRLCNSWLRGRNCFSQRIGNDSVTVVLDISCKCNGYK